MKSLICLFGLVLFLFYLNKKFITYKMYILQLIKDLYSYLMSFCMKTQTKNCFRSNIFLSEILRRLCGCCRVSPQQTEL